MNERLAAVAINRPFAEPFSYIVPEGACYELGDLVEVPLGTRKEIGCVVALDPDQPDDNRFRLRPIERHVAAGFRIDREIRELATWIADYYFCGIGEALAAVSLVGFSDTALAMRSLYRLSGEWKSAEMTAKQCEVANQLAAMALPPATLAELARRAETTSATLKKMAAAGALETVDVYATPHFDLPAPDILPELGAQQAAAFDAVRKALDANEFRVFLLHGATGSGKTEVYLRLIQRVLDAGKTALCLVPEISLTPQTVERFSRRFQLEIGVIHSQLSRREKRVLDERIRIGEIKLVIGARSATFAPLPNLGIVVIDEEHDPSYKQNETPRYHARDVAIVRAQRLSIPVVLGTATPSLDSYANALSEKYELLKLTERPLGLAMPRVDIVALGPTPGEPSLGGLSAELHAAIQKRLAEKKQVLLFLNRRGFSQFLFCGSCRWVARCDEDDVVKTIHRRGARRAEPEGELDLFPRPLASNEAFLKCHFCGQTDPYPTVCPGCGKEETLVAVGTGTQRVEENLRRAFPDARLLRLDRDAIGGRRAFLDAWRQMVEGEADIILGTQMIAKGLHLERVTLVGVILADIGLFIPDFRAEERTFSLLMQVAGRSGRIDPGEVIFQTYQPNHPAIQLAAAHDYEAFYGGEIERRRQLRFPPVSRLISLTTSDPDKARSQSHARNLFGILRRIAQKHEFRSVSVLGMRPAPIEMLGGRFRFRLLLRGESARANGGLLRAALADPAWRPHASTRLSIDVDPQDMM